MAGKPTKGTISIAPSHVAVRQSTNHIAIADSRVVKAMLYIREFACTGIDVSRVAKEVGMCRALLDRLFKIHLGETPKAEILRVQIERAKMLLARTDGNGKSIAIKCGFASLEYFTKAFRREVGMTPNAYRQMRRLSRDYGDNE
jgi:LacI family transcriptional regulator